MPTSLPDGIDAGTGPLCVADNIHEPIVDDIVVDDDFGIGVGSFYFLRGFGNKPCGPQPSIGACQAKRAVFLRLLESFGWFVDHVPTIDPAFELIRFVHDPLPE